MNTIKVKEIGKWLMVAGASIFTSGAGAYGIANWIEKKELKKEHSKNMMKIEEEESLKQNRLKEEALRAATEKDRLYSLKINKMDDVEFAKFHAKNIAEANDEVLRKAERIRKESEATIVKKKLECTDEINKVRAECLRKVEEAEKKRAEAVEKYEAINTLFTNKDKILKAKAALESAIEKSEKAKSDKEDLLDAIKDILE